MPQVLTTHAAITCPHGGLGTTTPATENWTVNGGAVLVEHDRGTLTCPFVVPCVGYTLRSMGLNAAEINNRKVILVTDFNQTDTGLPLTMTETHQTFDDSTAASIPNGASAPPLPGPLADVAAPVVVASPPAGAFNTTTQLPPVLPLTFTLTAPFPLKWILTYIGEPTGSHQDVTSGGTGIIVAPPGGTWSSPVLVVVVTLTLAFLGTLAPGLHHFYMAGVSQRGLSALGEAVVTVS
jgi:hypothetical protein